MTEQIMELNYYFIFSLCGYGERRSRGNGVLPVSSMFVQQKADLL